jgi:hypothetical protein
MNPLKTLARCLRRGIGALTRRRYVRWALISAAVLLGVTSSWVGYRLLGFWSDRRLVRELATAEPSLGFEMESWDVLNVPGWVGIDSFLFRPNVWRLVNRLFCRVGILYFRRTSDADLVRLLAVLDRYSYRFELSIGSDNITDAGVKTIARLKAISGVEIATSNAKFTDAGVAALRTMPNLDQLSIDAPGLSARCALLISRFPRLRRIALSQVWVSDEALDAFAAMKTLKALDVRCARFSEETVKRLEQLKESRPDLDIMY